MTHRVTHRVKQAGEAAAEPGARVYINGQARRLERPLSVAALLRELGLHGRLAVEVNGCIVPRGRHPEQLLRDSDRLEIVRAVGGG